MLFIYFCCWHEDLAWNYYLLAALIQNSPLVHIFKPCIAQTLSSTSPLPHQLTSPLRFPSHIAPTSTPPRGPTQEESVPLQQTSSELLLPTSFPPLLPPPPFLQLPLLLSRPHRFHVWAAHIDFHAGSWIILLLPPSQQYSGRQGKSSLTVAAQRCSKKPLYHRPTPPAPPSAPLSPQFVLVHLAYGGHQLSTGRVSLPVWLLCSLLLNHQISYMYHS